MINSINKKMSDSSSTSYESDNTDTESEIIVYEEDDSYLDNHSNVLDEIYDFEEQYQIEQTSEELHQKYFIGCYKYIFEENILLFVNKIHPKTFLKFDGSLISKYFFWFSEIVMPKNPTIEIMQLIVLPDDTYVAILKTFWIKIIQRKWKNVYKKRRMYVLMRMKLINIQNSQLYGKINSHLYSYPGLKGLLSEYSIPKCDIP